MYREERKQRERSGNCAHGRAIFGFVPIIMLLGFTVSGCQSQSFKVRQGYDSQGDAAQDMASTANSGSDASKMSATSDNAKAQAGYAFSASSQSAAENRESPSLFSGWFSSGGDSGSGIAKVPPPSGSFDKSSPLNDGPVGGVKKVPLTGMSLRDAVGLAIAHHPEISRAAAIVSQSASEVSVAKAAWFPTLEYNVTPGYGGAFGSGGNSTGVKTTVGASQLVYDFGRTSGTIELAEAGLNKQRHSLNGVIENVANTAATHYVEFAAAQAMVEAAREEITALRKTRDLISDRVKAGLSDASDLTQADVAMQRAIVDQVRAQTKMDVAASSLAEVIGIRPKSVANLMAINKAVLALSGGSNDIENAPSVLASMEAVKEAEARVRVTKSEYFPSLRLAASKSFSSGRKNADDSTWVGLSVGGAVSTAGQNVHRVNAARAEKDAAERLLQSQQLSSRTAVASAETEVAGAGMRKDAYNTMKDLSRTSRDLYWQEYTLNKRPLNQVLDSERDIFVAESERISAIADGIIARIKAHSAVGNLVRRLRGG